MNLQEYQYLQSELTELKKLLELIPKDHIIERIGFESRKQEVEAELAAISVPSREPVRATLTFRGRPVVGSYGIFAEFGSIAVNKFTDAIAKLSASLTNPLGSRGIIPNRDEYQFLITGTANGSFGFQLEEHAQNGETLFDNFSSVEAGLEKTITVMQASLGTDDELTDAVSEMDDRALSALHEFLKVMVDNEAFCTLNFKEQFFRFSSVGEVQRSMARLSMDNIHEEQQNLTGVFIGVLPIHRTFEFKDKKNDQVIFGKIAPNVLDLDELSQNYLYKQLEITVHTTRVGEGKPRYVLMDYRKALPDPVQ